MFVGKVQQSTPLWLWIAGAACFAACSACSADSESLQERRLDPQPTIFALKNNLSQSIWVRVFPGEQVHFSSVTDAGGLLVRRFPDRCLAECGGPPVSCSGDALAPASGVEVAAGTTLEESWDSTVYTLARDGAGTDCFERITAPSAPHQVQFCWSYAPFGGGGSSDEVCAALPFTPNLGLRVEHVVEGSAPRAITFELENQNPRMVGIQITTGCSGAAGWVEVIGAGGEVLQREYDCGECLCDDACAVCDCIGPTSGTIEVGSVASEHWGGTYIQGPGAGAACGSRTLARGSYIARFCWLRMDTRPSGPGTPACEDVLFTLGEDTVVRHVIR